MLLSLYALRHLPRLFVVDYRLGSSYRTVCGCHGGSQPIFIVTRSGKAGKGGNRVAIRTRLLHTSRAFGLRPFAHFGLRKVRQSVGPVTTRRNDRPDRSTVSRYEEDNTTTMIITRIRGTRADRHTHATVVYYFGRKVLATPRRLR